MSAPTASRCPSDRTSTSTSWSRWSTSAASGVTVGPVARANPGCGERRYRDGTGHRRLFPDPAPPETALAERRAPGALGGAEHRALRVPAEVRPHARSLATLAASRHPGLHAARL